MEEKLYMGAGHQCGLYYDFLINHGNILIDAAT